MEYYLKIDKCLAKTDLWQLLNNCKAVDIHVGIATAICCTCQRKSCDNNFLESHMHLFDHKKVCGKTVLWQSLPLVSHAFVWLKEVCGKNRTVSVCQLAYPSQVPLLSVTSPCKWLKYILQSCHIVWFVTCDCHDDTWWHISDDFIIFIL